MLSVFLRCAALTAIRRRAAQLAVVAAATCATLTAFAVPAGATANYDGPYSVTVTPPPGVAAPSAPVPASLHPAGWIGTPPRQLFVPDLIAAAPTGITAPQLAKISKLRGVQAVLPLDGGKVTINGKSANLLGVLPQSFRSWTPLSTAGTAAVWSALVKGRLISTDAAARRLHLAAGKAYAVSAAVRERLPFGGATALSVTGADAIVNLARSAQLGLVTNFAVLISAPIANLPALMSRVRSVIGKGGQVVNLVSYSLVTASNNPVATNVPTGTSLPASAPANYLDLFKQSAAQYCPSMSWTVLAAIGEIESGDGANDGPSSAGARGPMQFLPSTWAEWGIDAFGQTGPPDIMSPLDAVPSAARMLCSDGAGNSATLRGAIFAYNHATWYVDEVIALASEYAQNP